MSAGKATFITGIVVGATTGFFLGHLTLWSHVSSTHAASPERVTASLPDDFNPLLPEIDFWHPIHAPRSPGEVYYAPVADAEVRIGEATSPIDVSPPSDQATPPSFLPPPNASPIGVGVELDLRPVIEREAPDLSEQELEVWLDVLNGLSEDDALGILRMWQMNGGAMPPGIGPDFGGLDSRTADLDASSQPNGSFGTLADIDEAPASDVNQVLNQLRGITLHNIANAETPGYRSLVPIISNLTFSTLSETNEATRNFGIRLERVTLKIEAGRFIETGEQWDVAIVQQPQLYFKVLHDEELALTRYGHFQIDEQRRLSVTANGRSWAIDPAVILPEGTIQIRFAAEGLVQVRQPDQAEFSDAGRVELFAVNSPQALEPIGDRLYRLTDPLGVSPEPAESFELAQGFIEGSNVDVSAERQRLDWIDELQRLGR